MKKIIVAVIVTAIVCISGTVFAVTQIDSKEVTYDNTESGLESTNVQGALNELYGMSQGAKYKAVQGLGNGESTTVSLELEKGNWKLLIYPFRVTVYNELYNGNDNSNSLSVTGGTYTAASTTMAPISYDVTITGNTGTVTFTKALAGYPSTGAVMVAVQD